MARRPLRRPNHRPAPPPPPGVVDQLRDWVVLRGNRVKWTLGIIAAVAGAIVAVGKSWEYVEPYWYVSHYYLHHDYTDASIKPVLQAIDKFNHSLMDNSLDLAKGKRENASRDIAKWQLELTKPDNNATAKQLINESLRAATDTKESLDRQINSIERQRAREH